MNNSAHPLITSGRFVRFNIGFTLIELLIVIAIIGVLAAAVWVALDPLDKINAANDAKVQSDISSLAQAEEAYAVTHLGYYTDGSDNAIPSQTALRENGDIKQLLSPPAGYNPVDYIFYAPDGCTSHGGIACEKIVICGALKSKKYTIPAGDPNAGQPMSWIYSSASGKACTNYAPNCTMVSADNLCP